MGTKGKIYFQKLNASDGLGIDTETHSCDEWGVMPTRWDFAIMPEMKELPVNDWPDEDGDDEYVPDEPKFKSFEMDIEFAYKGADPVNDLGDFFHYLAYSGVFSIYDEHSGIGYHKCRYVKYEPDAHYIKSGLEQVVEFTITIKVIDPITKAKLA